MDPAVIKYYRRLLRSGFEHAGTLENPSIFLDTVREDVPICGNVGNYLHLYVYISNGRIEDIKYLCNCDPVSNVAVEIFCGLVKGKTLEAFRSLNEEAFGAFFEPLSEELREKARGLIELLNRGIDRMAPVGQF